MLKFKYYLVDKDGRREDCVVDVSMTMSELQNLMSKEHPNKILKCDVVKE